MKYVEFIMENWYMMILFLAVVIVAGAEAAKFFSLPYGEQKQKVKEWLLLAVTDAEKELAEVVQWAMANHIMVDSYATDVYASLRGKAVTGDFTDADAEVITEVEVDMKGNSLYVVIVGETDVDMPTLFDFMEEVI